MKYLKTFEKEEVIDSEIKNLFKELKFHDEKHREIDEKLKNIEKLKPLLTSDLSDFEIKNVYYNFYKDIYGDPDDRSQTVVFSFEKDMVLMWLNRQLKIREDAKKYNL